MRRYFIINNKQDTFIFFPHPRYAGSDFAAKLLKVSTNELSDEVWLREIAA